MGEAYSEWSIQDGAFYEKVNVFKTLMFWEKNSS